MEALSFYCILHQKISEPFVNVKQLVMQQQTGELRVRFVPREEMV